MNNTSNFFGILNKHHMTCSFNLSDFGPASFIHCPRYFGIDAFIGGSQNTIRRFIVPSCSRYNIRKTGYSNGLLGVCHKFSLFLAYVASKTSMKFCFAKYTKQLSFGGKSPLPGIAGADFTHCKVVSPLSG